MIAALLYLPRTGSRPSWTRSLHKALALAFFALAAWLAGAPALLVVALGLSVIGDFTLSRPGARAFLAGMLAFTLVHVAYIALMLPLWSRLSAGATAALAALVVLALSS